MINAIAAVRVSSEKQGLQGDSPDDQKAQIERRKNQLALVLGVDINIIQWFEFIESASVEFELQPILKALDYCKNPKNKIKYFFIKSIDRGTRGGATIYGQLKASFARYGVQFVDVYGLIGTQTVNTLEHLGVKYGWSEFNPTWITELLEAERGKGEVRDILTRMIGAEIRYVRMGYRVRQAAPGFMNEKIDTLDGKRVILKPHPIEAHWFVRMFELRAQGNLTDEEVVKQVNTLGYKSRKIKKHDPINRKQVIGYVGEHPLTVKQFQRYIKNPIYAGVNAEKWTDGKPIKTRFPGLISIELFNKANKGKITILEDGDQVYIYHGKPSPWQVKKHTDNPLYPYKKYVLCSKCRNILTGSASTGKMGTRHPAYHCYRRHYFRVPLADFDETIEKFCTRIEFSDEFRSRFREVVLEEWEKRKSQVVDDSISIEEQVLKYKNEAKLITDKIKILSSEIAIKAMETELEKAELEKLQLMQNRNKIEKQEIDITTVINYLQYYMEHLGELILGGDNSTQNAAMFGLLFDSPPTYDELKYGTPKMSPLIKLKQAFDKSEEQFVNYICSKVYTNDRESGLGLKRSDEGLKIMTGLEQMSQPIEIVLKTTLEYIAVPPDCLACGSPMQKAFIRHSMGDTKVIVTANAPGYRCTNSECLDEAISGEAAVEMLAKAIGIMETNGDLETAQALGETLAMEQSRRVA